MLTRLLPFWPWIAAGAVLSAFAGGWVVRGWKCDAALTKALQAAEKQRAKLQARVEESATSYEATRYETAAEQRDNQERIRIVYRDRTVPAACAVPDDARRVLESAVDRANARATGELGKSLPAAAEAP